MSQTSDKASAKAVSKETKQEPKIKKAVDLMYLGPTIVGVARHSTVFKDGRLPAKAQACINELPMMAKLFVPLSDMPEAIKELNKDQSVLRTVYSQVLKKFI